MSDPINYIIHVHSDRVTRLHVNGATLVLRPTAREQLPLWRLALTACWVTLVVVFTLFGLVSAYYAMRGGQL